MKRVPVATCRLQFNRDFTFAQAADILDYLRELGISDVYASPLFEAGPKSAHGYDVCCFGKLNGALGTTEEFTAFSEGLNARGMGLLLDIVPNHMSATTANAWWLDVLEHGRNSKYASYFDIDWDSPHPALQKKVLLPVLEDRYGRVLESGKLRLVFEQGKFFIAYHDQKFPIDGATLSSENTWDIRNILQTHNGTVGDARSFDRLDALIRRQHYRLAYWRVGSEEINYRRFFDVTELVGLRMELPEVFHATHELLFQLLRDGRVSGLRVDHPDGLRNPREYLDRLQSEAGELYVVAEKILSSAERLPDDWRADGTTGYDFLNRANALFVDAANARDFDAIYREFIRKEVNFPEIAYRSKLEILDRSFRADLDALVRKLQAVASRTRNGADLTHSQLRSALREVIARFPVYRTYVEETEISPADAAVVRYAITEAKHHSADPHSIDLLGRVLTLEIAGELEKNDLPLLTEFASKFQQLTGPAAAKGIEDTAFYRFNRLISLNEVGGNPDQFGIDVAEFHQANQFIATHWPHTMLATATHDTKRGEDVRARINLLSEMPTEWRAALGRWSKVNADQKTLLQGVPAPCPNDEYLLYQTLIGAWPDHSEVSFRSRISAFIRKAIKEAKVHTSWTEPNAPYEAAVQQFVDAILAEGSDFLEDFRPFQRRVAFFGRINSLAQTLLKLTCPGVPDFYQGSELWDLNLVDPDNRRPVDFTLRRQRLAELKQRWEAASPSLLLPDDEAGALKLFVIWRALNLRRERRELFQQGDYAPLLAEGAKRNHLCAFARTHGSETAIVIVPRLVVGLTGGEEIAPVGSDIWQDTSIPLPPAYASAIYENVLTREKVKLSERNGIPNLEVAQVLKQFPVALLVKVP